jgi:hypothetical protein
MLGSISCFNTGKLTYLLNPSNKLVGFYQWMTHTPRPYQSAIL